MRRPVVLPVTIASLAALGSLVGCSGSDTDEGADDDTVATVIVATTGATPARAFEPAVPFCDELPDPADSLDWSGIQRTDAPLPAQTRDALILALDFPYVVDYWGGTGDREGWIVIGVSGGAVELQQLIDLYHPGARVLAMPLDWTAAELHALADEVDTATASLGLDPAVVSISRGVVRVQLDTVTEERAALLDGFAERRVCLDGEFA